MSLKTYVNSEPVMTGDDGYSIKKKLPNDTTVLIVRQNFTVRSLSKEIRVIQKMRK